MTEIEELDRQMIRNEFERIHARQCADFIKYEESLLLIELTQLRGYNDLANELKKDLI